MRLAFELLLFTSVSEGGGLGEGGGWGDLEIDLKVTDAMYMISIRRNWLTCCTVDFIFDLQKTNRTETIALQHKMQCSQNRTDKIALQPKIQCSH